MLCHLGHTGERVRLRQLEYNDQAPTGSHHAAPPGFAEKALLHPPVSRTTEGSTCCHHAARTFQPDSPCTMPPPVPIPTPTPTPMTASVKRTCPLPGLSVYPLSLAQLSEHFIPAAFSPSWGLRTCSSHSSLPPVNSLRPGGGNTFCKGLASTQYRLCGPHGLCHTTRFCPCGAKATRDESELPVS